MTDSSSSDEILCATYYQFPRSTLKPKKTWVCVGWVRPYLTVTFQQLNKSTMNYKIKIKVTFSFIKLVIFENFEKTPELHTRSLSLSGARRSGDRWHNSSSSKLSMKSSTLILSTDWYKCKFICKDTNAVMHAMEYWKRLFLKGLEKWRNNWKSDETITLLYQQLSQRKKKRMNTKTRRRLSCGWHGLLARWHWSRSTHYLWKSPEMSRRWAWSCFVRFHCYKC